MFSWGGPFGILKCRKKTLSLFCFVILWDELGGTCWRHLAKPFPNILANVEFKEVSIYKIADFMWPKLFAFTKRTGQKMQGPLKKRQAWCCKTFKIYYLKKEYLIKFFYYMKVIIMGIKWLILGSNIYFQFTTFSSFYKAVFFKQDPTTILRGIVIFQKPCKVFFCPNFFKKF